MLFLFFVAPTTRGEVNAQNVFVKGSFDWRLKLIALWLFWFNICFLDFCVHARLTDSLLNRGGHKSRTERESEKMKKILQINLKFKVSRPELEKAFLEVAQSIADVKGLVWKVWLMNEAEKSAGGIYLFKDDASVDAYMKGKIVAGLKSNPAVSNIEAKVFDILPKHTKITRGPVD